jgi:hypothetical protein
VEEISGEKSVTKKSNVKRTIINFYSLFDLMATINFPSWENKQPFPP